MRGHLWGMLLGVCLLAGCGPGQFGAKPKGHFYLPKNVTQNLFHRDSDLRITVQDLNYWDRIVAELVKQSPPNRSGDTFRLYTYLYCGQKAFADASFQITSSYTGSIDSISIAIIRLFYPNYQNDQLRTDSYSKELSSLLMGQIGARYEREEKSLRTTVLPKKEGLWEGENPPAELSIPSMKTWAIASNSQFKSPKPPAPSNPQWNEQLEGVKRYARNATDAQKQRSFDWQEYTNPESTSWTVIAQNYMRENATPLEMQLEFRARFYMAMMDAMISVFRDKFAYMVARPIMRDPNFKPLFKTPNHPSYPSAHSSISSAAATILAYYFPENIERWKSLAKEAGISRLWAGIHFPIDNESGMDQGEKIAKAVLFE